MKLRRFTAAGGFVLLGASVALSGLRSGSRAYLWAWIFWAGLSLGALALGLLFRVTGGEVGPTIAPALERIEARWPIFAALFLPLLFALRFLYPWADPAVRAGLGGHAAVAFSPVFFAGRSVFYLLVWCGLRRMKRRHPAAALLLHVLVATLASIDWMLSLESEWTSTIYGLLLVVAQALGAYAYTLVVRKDGDETPKLRRDLGNLLLAFAMTWTYLAFMQFLIIWSGDLPREAAWYVHRSHGGWPVVAAAFALGIWAVPMISLLFRKTKMRPKRLRGVALGVLVAGALTVYWDVAPSFHPASALPSVADLGCFLGLGAIFLAFPFGGPHETV